MNNDHSQRKHARVSASRLKRVLQCSASFLEENRFPDSSGRAAEKGTALHEATDHCLNNNCEAKPDRDTGYTGIVGMTFNGFVMDTNDADAVQQCLDFARGIIQPGDEWWVEQSFDLSEYHDGWGGIGDLVIYRSSTGEMWVIDWKYGAGVPVEVVEDEDE